MADIIQWRRDTAANWLSVDPVLASGEAGFETDTSKMKHGDGVTIYSLLPYTGTAGGDHTLLTNIGTNTHAQLDTHLADASIHTEATGFTAQVALDQAAYDLLAPPDANTIYFVTA